MTDQVNTKDLAAILKGMSRSDRMALLGQMKETEKGDRAELKSVKLDIVSAVWTHVGPRLLESFGVGNGGTFSFTTQVKDPDGTERDVQFVIRSPQKPKAKKDKTEEQQGADPTPVAAQEAVA